MLKSNEDYSRRWANSDHTLDVMEVEIDLSYSTIDRISDTAVNNIQDKEWCRIMNETRFSRHYFSIAEPTVPLKNVLNTTQTKITSLLFFTRICMDIFNFSCMSSVAKALSLFWWNFVETFNEAITARGGLIRKSWNWSFPTPKQAGKIRNY